jgi:hypothetical protein
VKPRFEVEVESHKRERQRDWLGIWISLLRGPGVHDVLMNEGGVAAGEGVALQLLIGRRDPRLATHRVRRGHASCVQSWFLTFQLRVCRILDNMANRRQSVYQLQKSSFAELA